MSDLQPVDPIDECVRLAQELSRLQTEYKEMLDEAVVVESERNTLKRENAEMNDDIRCIELELSLLQAENAALRADKERLDWLARNRSVSATERPLSVTPESLRASIDAARKENKST